MTSKSTSTKAVKVTPVLNGNSVGLLVVGFLLLNVFGPITTAAGQIVAIAALRVLGYI